MGVRLALLAVFTFGLAGCQFPNDGVPLDDDDAPDARTVDAPGGDDGCVVGTEVCDGADQDCDQQIDEDFHVGDACDSDADGDLCAEGVIVCSGANATTCSDATDTIAEACNMLDDDCDEQMDEDFDLSQDEANCGACGNVCTAALGTNECKASTCQPECNNGAAVCGDPDDGCQLVNTNPMCAATSATPDITVEGDADGTTDDITGTTERFVRVRIVESDSGNGNPADDPTATLTLVSGAGTDWDLVVYCTTGGVNLCGDTSTLSSSTDVIQVGRDDVATLQTFDVIAEVRYDPTTPSTTCAPWTLTVVGDTGSDNRCGN